MAHTTTTELHAPDVDAIRRQLEQELQQRLGVLAELAPRALPNIDPVAHQTVVSNREIVAQITAALNRLDAGTYGRCIRCHNQIAPARLEARPHAAACVECPSHADAA